MDDLSVEDLRLEISVNRGRLVVSLRCATETGSFLVDEDSIPLDKLGTRERNQ
jgi:hypothetical protein